MNRQATVLLALLALLGVGKMAASTGAAFTATTANPNNTFTADTTFGCSAPGSQTLTSTKDSYVSQDSATNNFGTSADLFVKSQTSANRRTLVDFNLPSAPSGCTLTSATLRLNSGSAVTGRTLDAYRAAASWTETGVTWNNSPGLAGVAASTTSGTGWRTWDVLSQVQNMYSPGPNYGFIIRDSTENGGGQEQKFEARESTNDPQLVLVWG